MKLFDSPLSGNCYKVRLLLHQLDLEYERVEVDVTLRGDRPPALLERNPWGRVPVLELDDGRSIAESNAILFYLAEQTPYLPSDRFARGQVLQWLFFEQNAHEPNIAVARFIVKILGHPSSFGAVLADRQENGRRALAAMEATLAGQPFFVDDSYSIADIALYAYTHIAPEGGISLESYPAVRGWCERVSRQARHVAL